tara:strand:+ start:92 stop:619 length:528 start_codon:yes stop_codon:yes gene_type:complete
MYSRRRELIASTLSIIITILYNIIFDKKLQMVSSTYIGYGQTILAYQWTQLFAYPGATGFTDTAGISLQISPSLFLSYAGVGVAFIMSLLGAYDNAGKTLYYVEDSTDDFLKRYGKGKFEDIIDIEEKSDAMQTFLSTFTWDLIVYTTASFFHSFFLIFGGSFAAVWILLKIQTL